VPAVSTTIFHRRRAERFAQLLDEANGGRRHHVRSAVDDDLAELVAVGNRVSALQRSVDVQVDPEFRVGLRAMLVAAAEREAMGASGDGQVTIDLEAFRAAAQAGARPAPTARRLRTRGAIIVGVACGAIAVSGMSAASENAVPGDALYGVKRSTERAQLALASSDLTKGQLFLDFAGTRLEEARAVDDAGGAFVRVLSDMDANTTQGVRLLTTTAIQRRDPAALDAISAFLKSQRPAITDMMVESPVAEFDRAAESAKLLATIDERVSELRASLICGEGEAPGSDALGPLPFACATPSGTTDGETDAGPAGEPATAPGNARPEKSDPARQPAAGRDAGTTPASPAAPGATADSPAPSHPADPGSSDSDGGLVDQIGELLGGLLD
jgi:hypothetical protein